MGCDIHLSVEFRRKGGHTWGRLVLNELGERDYDMFSLMAGVRSENRLDPLFQPRGLPEDVSFIVKVNGEDSTDWHSHSWLSMDEFGRCLATYKEKTGSEPSPRYAFHYNGMLYLQIIGYDTRIVFWFDN